MQPDALRTLTEDFLPDGTNVNHELVKQGWCWWYRKYAPLDTELERLEAEARDAKKGLWVDPAPMPLWVYRKARRRLTFALSQTRAAKLLDRILALLKCTLQAGEPITISGFGKFTVRSKRFPRDGTPAQARL